MKPALFAMLAFLSAFADDTAPLPWEKAVQTKGADTAIGGASGRQTDPVARILAEDQGLTLQERLSYVKRCEKAAKRYPESALKATLCQRIGDVYFDVDRQRYAKKWSRWYSRAAGANPSLAAETPIGFRLQEYSKIAKRKNLLAGIFAVYMFVLMTLVARTIRGRRTFDARYFLKRLLIFFGIFTAMAGLVLALDLMLFSGSIDTFENQKAFIKPVTSPVRPFIPFCVMDPTAPGRAFVVFLAGFMPIAAAVFYTSFRKTFSRIFLSLVTLIFCASLWTHFFVITGFDASLKPKVTATGSRVLFSGEPEKLLLENPAKALRACPDLLKSGNEDLEKFIKEHYPEGLPRQAAE